MSRMTDAIMNAENVSEYSILFNGNLTVEHAVIVWPNFSGGPTNANPAGGKQTFGLVLSEDIAARLANDHWNVKVKEIKDEYIRGEKTRTVSFQEWASIYHDEFENSLIYTEIVVNGGGDNPPQIYKAGEYNGEKIMAPVPKEHWGKLDNSALSEVTVTIHPWKHGRNMQNPDAKKGYLNTMIAKIEPITSDLGNTYSDYRIVSE